MTRSLNKLVLIVIGANVNKVVSGDTSLKHILPKSKKRKKTKFKKLAKLKNLKNLFKS